MNFEKIVEIGFVSLIEEFCKWCISPYELFNLDPLKRFEDRRHGKVLGRFRNSSSCKNENEMKTTKLTLRKVQKEIVAVVPF